MEHHLQQLQCTQTRGGSTAVLPPLTITWHASTHSASSALSFCLYPIPRGLRTQYLPGAGTSL